MDLSTVPEMAQPELTTQPTFTVGRVAGLLRALAVAPDRWWHLVRFDGVPVDVDGMSLVAWPPGHHAGPGGDVVTVLAGELSERTVTEQGAVERTLRANRIRVYGAGDPRELVNLGPGYAIILRASIW